MRHASRPALVLVFALLLVLIPVPANGTILPASAEACPLVMLGPVIDPWFVNVWVGDGVDNHEPAVAYNPLHNEYLVVWWNDRGATRDIYARRVARDGTVRSWFCVVSTQGQWKWLPDVAYSPAQDEYLIVFTHKISTSDYNIGAIRVKWDGSWKSSEFPINQDADKQWYPAVAYNTQNDEYLVVYENYWAGGMRDIAAQRVKAADGSLLSWRNIATGATQIRRLPDVAYNEVRNEYLIAYTFQSSATADGDIFAKVTSHNMGTLSNEIHVVDNTFDQDGVAVAAGPDEYLLVWQDGPSATHRTLYSRRVIGPGNLAPAFTAIRDEAGQVFVEPDVAFTEAAAGTYLISWRHASSSATGDNTYGLYVKAGQGNVLDTYFTIDEDSNSQRSPAAACAPSGDCFAVEEDNIGAAADYEIRGRFVRLHRLALPMILKQ